ncbi:hypothetical protein KP509_01G103300 [Ceratopteris richardii]|uniref:Zinc finger PHD-type domain-containing protein n=1 Tax=Ceratopteris richardii TaxID=49495 RepID=A0A8T2VJ53_CERRI|nr:hypothetical protein KP509_01G103300 [Ceratopteris richardii]KAH7447362.1 hypothetical protein KP509_01G103300 [Ceratopteris richardii]
MKGGRARPPQSPQSEESWTVDCPCGVNYDDGEEMVDCDECGVWVHTGCCRILKGHTSYVCDRCKFKKKKVSEECEVAQLLVELPSKAPPLEENVFTVPTELSREERAHVQGIPGGDPSFFVGVSSVFSRQLWEYTGYVPKMFQFKYSDIPKEKERTCVLFAEYADKKDDSSMIDSAKVENQIDEASLMDTDFLPLIEVQTQRYYLSRNKSFKRDLKKESKNRHREQLEDHERSPRHNKRRKDDNAKRGLTNKRRSRSLGIDDHEGRPKSSYHDAAAPLKSARIASRNKSSAVYISLDDEDDDTVVGAGHSHHTKVEQLKNSTLDTSYASVRFPTFV